MRGVRRAAVALVALFCFAVDAHSTAQGPLASLSHPTIQTLEILPRSASHARKSTPELLHSDAFRLSLSFLGQTYHLHLSPTKYLLHDAARINHFRPSETPGGEAVLYKTAPLLPQDVRAYTGHVVHPDYTSRRFREDAAGGVASHNPSAIPTLGTAQITVHHYDPSSNEPPTFEGAFTVDGVVHHVATIDNYNRHRHPEDAPLEPPSDPADGNLVIFRDSDVLPHPTSSGQHMCGHDALAPNQPFTNPMLTLRPPVNLKPARYTPRPNHSWDGLLSKLSDDFPRLHVKRDDIQSGGGMNLTNNFISDIGSTYGCSQEQKIVYMGVAADCAYTQMYGSTQNATQQILTDWNMVTALYKSTFNISLGIVELSVQDATCPTSPDPSFPWNVACGNTTTLNDRLSSFSSWRGAKGAEDGAGLWHLMSGCPTGNEVGVAWLGVLCDTGSSGSTGQVVSGTAVSTATRTEWQVVSHEIGHNFGAIHDCTSGCSLDSGCCPLTKTTCDADASFLMSPVSMANQSVFSQCTLGNICSLLTQSDTTCLVSPSSNVTTISLQMCGNGIVEAGEECDPGSNANSTCCDAQTCKFKPGAVCDPLSSPCCTDTCGFAASTQTCRPAKDVQCDTPEMCTGTSADCPADKTTADGTSCGVGNMACASGTCTSISQQCQTVGASMNLTTACPQSDSSCQISCQDPTQSNQCIVLQSYLISGSPCGYGGKCYNNSCQPGSLLDIIKAWYTANLPIAIPVTVIAGIVILLVISSLFVCIRRCCRRRALAKTPPSAAFKPYPQEGKLVRPVSGRGPVSTGPYVFSPRAAGHVRFDSNDSAAPLRPY